MEYGSLYYSILLLACISLRSVGFNQCITLLFTTVSIQTGMATQTPIAFKYMELQNFTDNFSDANYIGPTQFGHVYRGKIGGKTVTVKMWTGSKFYRTYEDERKGKMNVCQCTWLFNFHLWSRTASFTGYSLIVGWNILAGVWILEGSSKSSQGYWFLLWEW